MAPYTNIPLSPAELSYLYTSLTQTPPVRPDGRSPTTFRPLVAETDFLPPANGSARICFADGTEAIVGVKAEVEKSHRLSGAGGEVPAEGVLGLGDASSRDIDMDNADGGDHEKGSSGGKGRDEWLEIAIEIPGMRDDDALPVFLAAMLTEALLADGDLRDRLWINNRYHWRLYIDVSEAPSASNELIANMIPQILLMSQPLSYPLPLLSLTTHLALLDTRLPSLISEKDEDPLFNDDWDASTSLYPRGTNAKPNSKPPATLLVMCAGDHILFDPTRDELAVADAVLAISVSQSRTGELKLVAVRTIDPPSRLTAGGVPDALNTTASGGISTLPPTEAFSLRETDQGSTVWRPPRGGVRRAMVAKMIKMVVEQGGVGEEVMGGLASVDT
nr:exosome complex component rrp42 [Quercus suber]